MCVAVLADGHHGDEGRRGMNEKFKMKGFWSGVLAPGGEGVIHGPSTACAEVRAELVLGAPKAGLRVNPT